MSKNLLNENIENPDFLSEQIITYIGNKRALLDFIGKAVNIVKKELGKEKLDILDVFSGSGIVSRYFKQHANILYTNDLESYCNVINRCYLTNKNDVDFDKLKRYLSKLKQELTDDKLQSGFISKLYAPVNDKNIKQGERVFYTTRNAKYIDTARKKLEKIPEPFKTYLMGPLLYEASVHNNTSGVFKGFYKNSKTGIGQYGGDGKNALSRITSNIELRLPIFSDFDCKVKIYQEDANELVKKLPRVDLAYMDPPYNQHPYGSNYFMLNLINDYKEPKEYSRVSGIPLNWNKSDYNKKKLIKDKILDLCKNTNATYLLISFSSDGFISKKEMVNLLSNIGETKVLDMDYNTFRGSRNLNNRDIHIKEFLYLVKKRR